MVQNGNLNPIWRESFEISWFAPDQPSYFTLRLFDQVRGLGIGADGGLAVLAANARLAAGCGLGRFPR
jgi:hypothetical protein